jgi:alpha-1,3-fucosyltransferase
MKSPSKRIVDRKSKRKRSIIEKPISIFVCIIFLQASQRIFLIPLRSSVVTSETTSVPRTELNPRNVVRILLYNDFWGSSDFHVGLADKPFSQCRISRCHMTSLSIRNGTSDSNLTFHSSKPIITNMSHYDAIVFHGVNFFMDARKYASIQRWRQMHHRFVFFMLEPPTFGPLFTSSIYNYFWNWTMTYRYDSDIWRPYGGVMPKKIASHRGEIPRALRDHKLNQEICFNNTEFLMNVLPKKGENFLSLAKRAKKVAWVVSNCQTPSKRENYVKELQKYIEIDVFGKCGTFVCDDRNSLGDCFTTIKEQYKFYLSFENSFAKDYVTEKFFSRMQDGLLPIVLGQANYSAFAPAHSYINAMDFRSPSELANYLHELDANDSEYLSYFWWWDYFHVVNTDFQRMSFCDLCAKLHESNLGSKTYEHFANWWHEEGLDDNALLRLFPNTSWDTPESKFQKSRSSPMLRMKFAGKGN